MKDLKHEGKEIKSELKAGDQDRNKQPGAYNPQQKQPVNKTNQQPLPGKGQNIGGTQGGFGGGVKDKDINKGDKGGSWK